MDVIAKTVFGIDIDSQNQPNDPFVTNLDPIFTFTLTRRLLMIASRKHVLQNSFQNSMYPLCMVYFALENQASLYICPLLEPIYCNFLKFPPGSKLLASVNSLVKFFSAKGQSKITVVKVYTYVFIIVFMNNIY